MTPYQCNPRADKNKMTRETQNNQTRDLCVLDSCVGLYAVVDVPVPRRAASHLVTLMASIHSPGSPKILKLREIIPSHI